MAWFSVKPPELKTSRGNLSDFDLPEVDDCDDLLDQLESLGWSRQSGMSMVGVTYSELYHWIALTGQTLTKWEIETLFLASQAHAEWLNRAENPDATAPEIIADQINRALVIQDKIFS